MSLRENLQNRSRVTGDKQRLTDAINFQGG